MSCPTLTADNPFATRYVRPGALEYRFPGDESAASLIARLRDTGWHGQIIGPHGSGKTALLLALLPLLNEAGRNLVHLALRNRQRRLPRDFFRTTIWRPATLLVVDGYEQLGRVARWRLRLRCRRSGCGLLVTSHRDAGLPTLFSPAPTLADVESIVRRLTENSDNHAESTRITDSDVQRSFTAHRENVRQALLDLYNLYERRSRCTA